MALHQQQPPPAHCSSIAWVSGMNLHRNITPRRPLNTVLQELLAPQSLVRRTAQILRQQLLSMMQQPQQQAATLGNTPWHMVLQAVTALMMAAAAQRKHSPTCHLMTVSSSRSSKRCKGAMADSRCC